MTKKGHLRPSSNGDAHVGGGERGGVVYPVPDHRHVSAGHLELLYLRAQQKSEGKLVCPCENRSLRLQQASYREKTRKFSK